MSIYSEAEHAIALTDTLYWNGHSPMTPFQRYLFGRYPSPLIYRYIMDFLVDFAHKLIENPYFLDLLPAYGRWL